MRVAPVSADLLVKLAVGAALFGAAVLAVRSMVGAVQTAADGVWTPIDNALTEFGDGTRRAAGAVVDGVQYAVDATGGQSYTSADAYTVPDGHVAPWYMGGAVFPVKTSQQADVRRIDNAIEAGAKGGWSFPYSDFSRM